MRRWPVTLLAAGAARATPGARILASSPRELLVADAVEALYELPPLPAQTDARELTTYEEAWTRRLPRLDPLTPRALPAASNAAAGVTLAPACGDCLGLAPTARRARPTR